MLKRRNSFSFLLVRVLQVNAPVLAPTLLVLFRANRVKLTPADRQQNVVLRDAHGDQLLFDIVGSPLRKHHIVDQLATRGRISFHVEVDVWMFLEPVGIRLKRSLVSRCSVFIPRKQHFFDGLVELGLRFTEEIDRRRVLSLRRRWKGCQPQSKDNPESNGTGRRFSP
jgi:hypothetical protein